MPFDSDTRVAPSSPVKILHCQSGQSATQQNGYYIIYAVCNRNAAYNECPVLLPTPNDLPYAQNSMFAAMSSCPE